MKKVLSLLFVAVLTVSTLAGCGSDKEKLYILNWGEYMDLDIIEAFEEEYGVEVIYEEVASNEVMETKIKAGATSYDLAMPSDYMIEKLISEDMLLPVNLDNIPNVEHIDPRFMGMNYDSNNEYSVPYFWGTLGIIYNYELVDAADLTGWDVLWNEKYENNIYMYDGVRDAFTPALLDLGYSLNSTNDSELEEAKNHLIDQLPILRGFGTDDIKYLVSSGDAALGVTFNGDFLDMVYEIEEAEEEVTVGYFVPENGTNLWFDAMVIPNTAQNPELAEKFMNFISSPENAQLNTEWVGYSTVNKTAYDNMFNDEDYVEWVTDPSYYPSNDVINASEVYIDLGEYNEVYDMLFTEVKSNN